jgi:hypothetical protein
VLPDTTSIRLQAERGTPSFNDAGEVSGRLEVFHDGRWGTVCAPGFVVPEARVACRMLGAELGYQSVAWSYIAPVNTPDAESGPVWLGLLECDGQEATLEDCQVDLGWSNGEDISEGFGTSTWADNWCDHTYDVGVSCTFRENDGCETCVEGKYSDSTGTAACAGCVAGTFSGSSAASCEQCEAGTISSAGSSSCSACASTFSDADRTACGCALGSGRVQIGPEAGQVVPETTEIRLQTNDGTPSFDSNGQVQGRLEVKVGDNWYVLEQSEHERGGEAAAPPGTSSRRYQHSSALASLARSLLHSPLGLNSSFALVCARFARRYSFMDATMQGDVFFGGTGEGGEAEATVACRQLGDDLGYTLVSASKVGRDDTDAGSGASLMLICEGTEPTLDMCSTYESFGTGANNYDVGVSCTFLLNSEECEECVAGKYSGPTGAEGCMDCTAGSYSSTGATSCEQVSLSERASTGGRRRENYQYPVSLTLRDPLRSLQCEAG